MRWVDNEKKGEKERKGGGELSEARKSTISLPPFTTPLAQTQPKTRREKGREEEKEKKEKGGGGEIPSILRRKSVLFFCAAFRVASERKEKKGRKKEEGPSAPRSKKFDLLSSTSRHFPANRESRGGRKGEKRGKEEKKREARPVWFFLALPHGLERKKKKGGTRGKRRRR